MRRRCLGSADLGTLLLTVISTFRTVLVVCAEVEIPAFMKGKSKLSPTDIETTRKLANVRIHVERVIGLVRQKYTILSSAFQLICCIQDLQTTFQQSIK